MLFALVTSFPCEKGLCLSPNFDSTGFSQHLRMVHIALCVGCPSEDFRLQWSWEAWLIGNYPIVGILYWSLMLIVVCSLCSISLVNSGTPKSWFAKYGISLNPHFFHFIINFPQSDCHWYTPSSDTHPSYGGAKTGPTRSFPTKRQSETRNLREPPRGGMGMFHGFVAWAEKTGVLPWRKSGAEKNWCFVDRLLKPQKFQWLWKNPPNSSRTGKWS